MSKIILTAKQIDFLKYMLEIDNQNKAVERFADILEEERVSSEDMPNILFRIMKNFYASGK